MCNYFKRKTNVAQNLIDNFFSNFDFSIWKILSEKKKKFYNNDVQKLKLNKIHTTVPRQEYCVLTGENENPIQ